jgi:serine/threonine-protein kinase
MDYLVMEFIPGESLADLLRAGPMPEKQVAALGLQVAAALEEAHERGVVHRDLKPGNILVTPKGHAKVVDFGLAKLMRPEGPGELTASLTQHVSGTLPYMAPEQLRNDAVDARTDLYALGLVLYEMATGLRPFRDLLGTRLSDAILHQDVPLPSRLQPGISAELERIILKCVEKEPENRYHSAKEVAVDLRRVGSGSATRSMAQAGPPPKAQPAYWKMLGGTAAAATVLLAAALAFHGGGLRTWWSGPVAPAQIRSVAVLPMENLSRDPEQEYFVDGMTEAVITELSRIKALKVISRTSVMQFKGVKGSLPEIARRLNVDGIVEGSVIRTGNRIRVTVQLIEAASDTHLWAQSYERDLTDILDLQRDIARQIAREIRVALTPAEEKQLAAAGPVNPEAHELYLKGRYYWNKFFLTEEGLKRAGEYFEQTIAKDPSYAPAYAALADCLWESSLQGFLPAVEAYPQARALAQKALELDENLADAMAVEAAVRFYFDWNWAEAEEGYKKAIAANSNYANAYRLYGYYLLWMGHPDPSIAKFSRALELDPLSLSVNLGHASAFGYAQRYDLAIQHLQKTLELDPGYAFAHQMLAVFYLRQSKIAQAVAAAEKSLSLSGRSSNFLRTLGQAYVAAGRRADALKILSEMEQLRKQKRVRATDLAALCGSLGRMDQAFQWMDMAVQERESALVQIQVNAAFDSLRQDPRFQALLRRMNFPS